MKRRGWALLLALCAGGGAAVSRADVARGDGATTGDGSTPFTGLAAAPEANLFAGSAETSIPIEVPPGRKSLTPKLALTYSSSAGPSPYGYGWDLPLGRVQRSTTHGLLSCSDSTYRNDFVLALPGANVECTLDPASNRCAPKVEESFLDIQYDSHANAWDVWDRSGLHYTFGNTPNARTGGTTSQLFVPGTLCAYTFSWALTRIEDPNGNTVLFWYKPLSGVLYPFRIRYGGTGARHAFEVDFYWKNRPLSDQIANSMGGFSARLTKILDRIRVRYKSSDRYYTFTYTDSYGSHLRRVGRQTFLSAVTLTGSDGELLSRVDGQAAATVFAYEEHTPDNGRFGFGPAQYPPIDDGLNLGVDQDIAGGGHQTIAEAFDINGDGFVDEITMGWSVHLGSAAGPVRDLTYWGYPPVGDAFDAIRRTVKDNQSVCGEAADFDVTVIDTFDIDGDGIPDHVDARATPWTVYRGSATGEFLPGIPWPAPLAATHRSITNAHFGGHSGSADIVELRDWNGDGLPDLVEAPGHCQPETGPTTWRIWLNRGTDFASDSITVWAPANVISFFRNDGQRTYQEIGTFDINDDGLPDVVRAYDDRPTWSVWLNKGINGLDVERSWFMAGFGRGAWALHLDEIVSSNATGTHRYTEREFVDMNGDGLPDVLDLGDSSTWLIRLNTGNGFTDVLPWASNGAAPYLRCATRATDKWLSEPDLIDIDGDGLIDFAGGLLGILPPEYYPDAFRQVIWRNLGGAWETKPEAPDDSLPLGPLPEGIEPNPSGGRPDALVAMENGIGGRTRLEYRPSTQWDNTGGDGVSDLPFVVWTVTRVERDDGLCDDAGFNCLTPGSHTLVSNIRYQNGRFDPVAREFHGFQLVWQEDDEPTNAGHKAAMNWFEQTGALKGKVQLSGEFAAVGGDPPVDPWSNPLVLSWPEWQCADPKTGAVHECPSQASGDWVRAANRWRLEFSADGSGRLSVVRNLEWPQCNGRYFGNVAHTFSGDAAEGGAGVDTHTEYLCAADTHIADKPSHVRVADRNDTRTLEEKWFAYDAQGNVTLAENWIDTDTVPAPACTQNSARRCAQTSMTYDATGSLQSVTDANGGVTTTEYDRTNIYPSYVTRPLLASEGDAHAHQVATTFDPWCGKPVARSAPYRVTKPTDRFNGRWAPTSRRAYDAFCRPVAGALPDESLRTLPHEKIDYVLGARGIPTRVVTSTREPHHDGNYAQRTVFLDAIGRVIEEKREAVVDDEPTTVAATTTYDARGNVASRSAPVEPGGDLAAYTSVSGPVTQLEYDPLRRVTRTTDPAGEVRESDYSIARQTTTTDECYHHQTAACPGSKLIERRDALGRVVEKDAYEREALKSRTKYEFDGLNRLRTTTQGDSSGWNDATAITVEYDSLGHKLSMVDPDAPGTWWYGYDLVGNLRYQDDPNPDQHVEWCYDAENRPLRKFVVASDYAGGALIGCEAGGDVVYSYDNPALANGEGRLWRVDDRSGATIFQAYDVRGRTAAIEKQITVDGQTRSASTSFAFDAADHVTSVTYPDGEEVPVQYDAAGQISGLGTDTPYIFDVSYDSYGRPVRIWHANGVFDFRAYHGAAHGYRLARVTTLAITGTFLDLALSDYAPNGLLTRVDDGASGNLNQGALYTYDGMGRLIGAQGPNLPYGSGYAYDSWGNLIAKEGMTLTYDAVHPHMLDGINGSNAGVIHDLNGNRKGKPGQTYAYDAEDRLTTITAGGATVQNVYDYTGRRVAMKVGTNVTRYFSELAEVTDGTLTKHYFAGDMRVASQRVSWTPPLASAAGSHNATMLARTDASGGPAEIAAVHLASASMSRPALVVLLRKDVQLGIAIVGGLGVALLLVVPGQRQRIVGIAVRRGHVVLVITAWSMAITPWPLELRRAEAAVKVLPMARDRAARGAGTVWHYHCDHLGSTQVITNAAGQAIEHIRYNPYGDIRGRYDDNGQPVAASYRYEFTAYETDIASGLQYAGARFYDPALGTFLTHDPAREYASPYAYVHGDPVNGTDPNGSCELLCLAIIGLVIGFTASSIQAGIQGATLTQTLKAGIIGGAIGAASGSIGSYLLSAAKSLIVTTPLVTAGMNEATAQTVTNVLALSTSLGQASYGLSRGDYAGIIGLGLNYGVAAEVGGEVSGSSTSGPSGEATDTGSLPGANGGGSTFADHAFGEMRLAGRIISADVEGVMIATAYGIPRTFALDLSNAWTSLVTGNPGAFLLGIFNAVLDVPFPKYGFFGGRNYGTADSEFGPDAAHAVNKVDLGNLDHDIHFRHAEWVSDVWHGPGLAPGPFGNFYRELGTPFFALAGRLQPPQ